MAHPLHALTDDDRAPVTVPVPREVAPDWPGGDERVVQVPAALLLAARGQCSCHDCCEGFVHMLRRSQLHAV